METKQELRDKIKELESKVLKLNNDKKELHDIIDRNTVSYTSLEEELSAYKNKISELKNTITGLVMPLLDTISFKEAVQRIVKAEVKKHLKLESSSFSEMYGSYGESVELLWDGTKIGQADITQGHYDDD